MPFLAALTPIQAFFVRLAITVAIGAIQQNSMKKKMAAMRRASASVMVNTASNNESIPVVYGRTRLGGNRSYIESSNGSGDTNGTEYLNMILTLCEGKTGAIHQLWFDDKIVWDADNGGTIDGSGRLGGFQGDYAGALNDSATVVVYHAGDDNQTVDTTIQASVGSSIWSNDHRLRGITYLALKLKANADAYKGSLPLITAVVDGRYIAPVSDITAGDTSRSFTLDGADQNPVDVLYDCLTNTRFGKGLDHDADGNYLAGYHIDIDSFKTSRTKVSGYFKVNGVVDTSQLLYNNIGEILESMNGVLVFQNGKYRLKIKNSSETSVKTFTADEILGDVSINMPSKETKFNKITAEFRNAASGTDYNDDIEVVENGSYLAQDNSTVLESQIRLDLVSDRTLVNSIATYQMNASRYQMVINFTAPHTALKVECGDIITMQLPEFGWSSGKQFRVSKMELTAENTINIVAQEYESSIELI